MTVAAVKLVRGSNTSLSELLPILGTVVVGFGWKVIEGKGPIAEMVPSAIVCNAAGLALSDEHLVFFNQLATPDGAVEYVQGDEEQIEVDLATIPESVDKLVFVVYADPDLRHPGNFGAVRNAYLRICDRSGAEMVRYDIEDSADIDVTAMIFGEIYRHRDTWKVRAVGQGYKTGLTGVAKDFGVTI
ncbi:MAG: tellurium resistance protein TerD [Solirubrobacteraceae bacterium]|nr:tellurium resistance protein TerD [Solirubrobacteraceae bacterium]